MTVIAELTQAIQMIAWKKANVWKNKITRIVLIQKKQNYQNDSDYKIAEVTSNGRLKDFFVTENAVNLPNYEHSKAEVYPFSKGLKFFLHLILLIN